MRLKATFAISLLLLLAVATFAQLQTYTLSPFRGDGAILNDFEIVCNGPTPGQTILFYRNGQIIRAVAASNSIMYSLNFTNDGQFSCGVAAEGESQQVTLLPSRGAKYITQSRTEYAEVGKSFTMAPHLGPGSFHSRYFIDWYKDGQGRSTIQGPRLNPPLDPNLLQPGYSTNESSFHLTIAEVKLEDEGHYFGELGCIEATQSEFFDDTLDYSIELRVYKLPVITSPPKEVTVNSRDGEVQFNCVADAYPRPVIMWTVNGNSVNAASISSSGNSTNSTLTLNLRRRFFQKLEENPEVSCIATIEDPEYPQTRTVETTRLAFLEIERAEVRLGRNRRVQAIFIELSTSFSREDDFEIMISGQRLTQQESCREDRTIVYVPSLNENIQFEQSQTEVKLEYLDVQSMGFIATLPEDECYNLFLTIVIPCAIVGTVVVLLTLIIAMACGIVKRFEHSHSWQVKALNITSEETRPQLLSSAINTLRDYLEAQGLERQAVRDFILNIIDPPETQNPTQNGAPRGSVQNGSTRATGNGIQMARIGNGVTGTRLTERENHYEELPSDPTSSSNVSTPAQQNRPPALTSRMNSIDIPSRGTTASGPPPPPGAGATSQETAITMDHPSTIETFPNGSYRSLPYEQDAAVVIESRGDSTQSNGHRTTDTNTTSTRGNDVREKGSPAKKTKPKKTKPKIKFECVSKQDAKNFWNEIRTDNSE